RISAGVLSSFPTQKGQALAFGGGGTEPLKSEGRRPRSVEMMTHRPTTGSLRSSGIALHFMGNSCPGQSGAGLDETVTSIRLISCVRIAAHPERPWVTRKKRLESERLGLLF